MNTRGVQLVGWGASVPNRRVTNAELESRLDTTAEWIAQRTGIHERRIAGSTETTASLAADAVRAALNNAKMLASDIDLLIVATSTPEQFMPHTGAFVGEMLGARCASFDLNTACSGFVYALVVGASMVTSGMNTVVVVGAETMSRITDQEDRSTAILFGDGAGAIVLTTHGGPSALLGYDLGCDGSQTGILGILAGGSRRPTSRETLGSNEQFMHMNGQEVYKRAVRAVVESATATLERCDLIARDLAWFIPHQANLRIIEAAAQRVGIAESRVIVNLDRFGNTSAASIPMALCEAADDGRLQPGDRILLSGFGAGLTWASAIIEWNPA